VIDAHRRSSSYRRSGPAVARWRPATALTTPRLPRGLRPIRRLASFPPRPWSLFIPGAHRGLSRQRAALSWSPAGRCRQVSMRSTNGIATTSRATVGGRSFGSVRATAPGLCWPRYALAGRSLPFRRILIPTRPAASPRAVLIRSIRNLPLRRPCSRSSSRSSQTMSSAATSGAATPSFGQRCGLRVDGRPFRRFSISFRGLGVSSPGSTQNVPAAGLRLAGTLSSPPGLGPKNQSPAAATMRS